jgi:hypothetical protein
MLGILGAFLLALRSSGLGLAAVAATLVGMILYWALEATSYGD